MYFKTTLILLSLLSICTASANQPVHPPYLQTGDTIAIIAPAGKVQAEADTTRIRERFEQWGLRVRFGTHFMAQSHPYLAGEDSLRANDLQSMINDPSVKAIIAYKGGYGSVRLLPMVQLDSLRHHPKWIVGFSDITLLHLALQRIGVESIHGAMPSRFCFRPDEVDASAETLRQALFGQVDTIATAPHPLNQPGEVTGTVAGGNLTLILSTIGTPEQLDLSQPTILLIEEVGEAVYRLDRMMQQLLRSGMLRQVKGVLVGHFTAILEAENFGEPYAVLDEYLRELGIPIIYGFPAGHEDPNTALYMGRQAQMQVDAEGARLIYP